MPMLDTPLQLEDIDGDRITDVLLTNTFGGRVELFLGKEYRRRLDTPDQVIGIDGWGFDRPAGAMLQDYLRTGDCAALLPAHMVGRDREYCHIEKMANLDKIPVAYGFWVVCFPIKVERGSAGWVRAVALVGGGPECA